MSDECDAWSQPARPFWWFGRWYGAMCQHVVRQVCAYVCCLTGSTWADLTVTCPSEACCLGSERLANVETLFEGLQVGVVFFCR